MGICVCVCICVCIGCVCVCVECEWRKVREENYANSDQSLTCSVLKNMPKIADTAAGSPVSAVCTACCVIVGDDMVMDEDADEDAVVSAISSPSCRLIHDEMDRGGHAVIAVSS